MILQIVLLLFGFAILIKGADVFIDGAASTAYNLKVPKLVIGLTILAFGTSMPELAVSFKAISSGSGDIVIGNVVGSCIANVLLVLGLTSLFNDIKIKNSTAKKEIPISILISALLVVVFLDSVFDAGSVNFLSRSDAVVILLFFSVFVYYLVALLKGESKEKDNDEKPKYKLFKSILLIGLGLVAIVLGSNFVVDSATKIATLLGVSQRVISILIIALGTSLPEAVTSIVSNRKGEQEILVGNIIGSNIFNIGIVLALPVAMYGGITGVGFSYVDLFMLFLSSIILFLFAISDKKINKIEGITMLILFVLYNAYLLLS